MQEIIAGIFTFTGLMAGRSYLIQDSDDLTLIDTSITPSSKRILKQIEGAGHQLTDVKRILITHAHPDHIGALYAIHAATQAQVFASPLEKPVIEGEKAPELPPKESLSGIAKYVRPPMPTFKRVPVDRLVQDGDILPDVMGGLQVIGTPGHAPGHLAFWLPEKHVLFCGDVIFRFGGPRFNKIRLPFAMVTYDMTANMQSIQKIAALKPEVLLFGHGRPLVDNTAALLQAFADKVNDKK